MPKKSRGDRDDSSGKPGRAVLQIFAQLLGAVLATGCLGARGLTPAELDPVVLATPGPAALPDHAERAAAELAALALADRDDLAEELLPAIQQHDESRLARGETASGLWDDANDLLQAGGGESSYTAYARRTLDSGHPDAALRRMLRLFLDSQPLTVAARKLHEDRMQKIAVIANRLIAPVSRLALGGSLNPIQTGRRTLASLLTLYRLPEATVRERQALRAYRDFLEHNPESPEAQWVLEEVSHYQEKRARQLHEEALSVAERALKAHQPEIALAHLDRAERVLPGDDDTRELRTRATSEAAQRRSWIRRSFRPGDIAPTSDGAQGLAAALMIQPMDRVLAIATEAHLQSEVARDELAFMEALALRSRGDEDAFFAALAEVARWDPTRNDMARHAAHVVRDRQLNPYAAYRSARAAERRSMLAWLFLGRYARGIPERDLPRPAEWVLAIPGVATTVLTSPLRLLQYPAARVRFGARVVNAAEAYLARFPGGAHADELHRELERRYEQRHQWSQALAHYETRPDPDSAVISKYREKIAERALAAARQSQRLDVQISIYSSVAAKYPDTASGKLAASELDELLRSNTPQAIRISKEFLIEHPALWRIGALGLKPELMDGKAANGELADDGVTLLGRRYVRIELVDAEPVVVELPGENFALFIAGLEEASYRRLVADERERPEPDPARDLFFERARLGLLDRADLRPTARSGAVFRGSQEKHGLSRRRESILPVEVALQGSLEDFGFAAVPRLKIAPESPDAFLYR